MGIYIHKASDHSFSRGDGAAGPAKSISFNSTPSGLEADNVQDAVDEVAEGLNGLIKHKDIFVSIPVENTWYSYDYSADNDLKDATILNVFFVFYGVSDFGITQVNLNNVTKIIWYGSTVSAGQNTIRVVYK